MMNNWIHRNSTVAVLVGLLLVPVSLLYADNAGRTATLNLYPAQGLLGTDVMSAGGHEVGHISDFVFDFQGHPRLTDVIVSTGLFGPARAVPVGAIRMAGDQCRINVSKDAFTRVAPLPHDVSAYFANGRQVALLAHEFHLSVQNRGGHYVTYSSLQNQEVVGKAGSDIGFLTNALINVDDANAFYLAVVPTAPIIAYHTSMRLEIPAADVMRDHAGEIDLDTRFGRSLIDAKGVSEIKGFSSSMTPEGEVYHLQAT